MTHVSKQTLSANAETKLVKQLAKFFADQSALDIEDLFSDLLSPAEQVMIIKRLAIIILLLEKQSTYAIGKTLQVSDSTVREISIKLQLDKYCSLVKRYENKKFDSQAFLHVLEMLLNAGMPSLGKDRWKSLR